MSSMSGSSSRSSGRTILAVILGVIALVFIVVAVIYLAEPAKSLPSFIPGHIAGSTGHHPLKATGCVVVGIVFAVGAWFALAFKPKPQAPAHERQGELARRAELTSLATRIAPASRSGRTWALGFPRLCRLQCLPQVVDQVVAVLDADREPDQVGRDLER